MSRATARLLSDTTVEIAAVAVKDPTRHRAGLPATTQLLSTPEQLLGSDVDLVVEAASREAVAQWARPSLGMGVDFIVSSVAALADEATLSGLREVARNNGARLCISTGALAGIDALSAARSMGVDEVEHRIIKPPLAWTGTPAEDLCDLGSVAEPEVFFTGSADEAATQYPKNANSAMTTALAGIGPTQTRVTLIADPEATGNRHELRAAGPFGSLEIGITNRPLEENPKTSAMAALSLARAIRNRVDAVVI